MLMSHEGDWENMFLSFIFTVCGKKLRGMRAGQWTCNSRSARSLLHYCVTGGPRVAGNRSPTGGPRDTSLQKSCLSYSIVCLHANIAL